MNKDNLTKLELALWEDIRDAQDRDIADRLIGLVVNGVPASQMCKHVYLYRTDTGDSYPLHLSFLNPHIPDQMVWDLHPALTSPLSRLRRLQDCLSLTLGDC